MALDIEIVKDFVVESKSLIEEMMEILEKAEDDYSQVALLATYGNLVDRIMGGAQSLAELSRDEHAVHMIADYSALCKAVGYKTSQIEENESFYNVCVGLLFDATETLEFLVDNIEKPPQRLRESITAAFIDRVRWVSHKFNEAYSMSVGTGDANSMAQAEIDSLLKKLGL